MYDVLSLVLIYSALSSTLTYIHMHVLLEYAFLCKPVYYYYFFYDSGPSVRLSICCQRRIVSKQAKYINSSCCIKINDRSLRMYTDQRYDDFNWEPLTGPLLSTYYRFCIVGPAAAAQSILAKVVCFWEILSTGYPYTRDNYRLSIRRELPHVDDIPQGRDHPCLAVIVWVFLSNQCRQICIEDV